MVTKEDLDKAGAAWVAAEAEYHAAAIAVAKAVYDADAFDAASKAAADAADAADGALDKFHILKKEFEKA